MCYMCTREIPRTVLQCTNFWYRRMPMAVWLHRMHRQKTLSRTRCSGMWLVLHALDSIQYMFPQCRSWLLGGLRPADGWPLQGGKVNPWFKNVHSSNLCSSTSLLYTHICSMYEILSYILQMLVVNEWKLYIYMYVCRYISKHSMREPYMGMFFFHNRWRACWLPCRTQSPLAPLRTQRRPSKFRRIFTAFKSKRQ